MANRISRMPLTVLLLLSIGTLAVGLLRAQTTPPKKAIPEQKRAGTVRENPRDGLKYVWIPPGTFRMGCSPGDSQCSLNEKPAHLVRISKGFWLGQTEVTVGAYKRFSYGPPMDDMRAAPSFNPYWANNNMPMVRVTWDDAQVYCAWAGGRLPTEAEWEYAARAGNTKAWYGLLDEIAWYDRNSGGAAHEAGQKRANAWGIYDMVGNVWEWISDWYDESYYRDSPPTDPKGPSSGDARVLRGASWAQPAGIERISVRYGDRPDVRRYDVGFRCVRDSAP